MKKSGCKGNTFNVTLEPNLSDEFISDLLQLPLEGFKGEYLRKNLLSKYSGEGTTPADERSRRAISKWLARERINAKTNQRLLLDSTVFRFHNGTTVVSINSDAVLATAARFVAKCIGQVTDLKGAFSSGASTSKGRRDSSTDEKFASQGDVTPACEAVWAKVLFENPMLARTPSGEPTISRRVVRGNILFCVPKTSEIDRVACKEPDLNMYVQKGIGDHVRRSLRKQGINLNDQTINQRLAREGSITNSLATLDLSSASDSMTTQLCCRLFDPDWFDLLMRTRSPSTQVDGEWVDLEMMSSMGNGFTFEVESLVFWALARACAYHAGVSGKISVYGDDIIVPSRIARLLGQVLGFCGFNLNPDKSFWDGPFRESCGSHWYSGQCVKPFFIRRAITTINDLILHLNALRIWCSDGSVCDPRFYPFWEKWASKVPRKLWGGYASGPEILISAPQKGTQYKLTPVYRNRRRNELGSYVRWWHGTEVEDLEMMEFSRSDARGFRLSKDLDSVRKVADRVVFFDAESQNFA